MGPEEGGRSQLTHGPTADHVPVPRSASERDAGLEASIRLKFRAGEPLSGDEREYLARLPGDDEFRYQ